MGKVTGFLELDRETPQGPPPAERTKGFDEYTPRLGDDALKRQGARCMDCGVPFCQSATGCPVDNRIPEWNDLVFRGQWKDALARLHATNNFPEFTGRVCPAPCESACVLGISESPVAIKAIESAIVDKGFEEGWIRAEPPPKRTGKRVAIVGSGPAGLAAAQQLNRVGHQVTVYERNELAGGLLTFGIPAMKLDKALVARRVKQLEDEGVEFLLGVEVGQSVTLTELRVGHDAVLLTVGANRPRDLVLPGRELSGIHFAMEFLSASTRSVLSGTPGKGVVPQVKGKRVLVIGGGDTGTDCVATSLRLGAKSVVQLELMPRPPDARALENPWPEWPRIFRVDYGQEEVAAAFGSDPRQFAVSTVAFVGDGKKVTGVETVGVAFKSDEGGRRKVTPVAGSKQKLEAEVVLLALGFLGPEVLRDASASAEGEPPLAVFEADYGDFATNTPGVFSAGDCRRGQSLVVWAIAEGRGAAKAVDTFLMGESELPAPD